MPVAKFCQRVSLCVKISELPECLYVRACGTL